MNRRGGVASDGALAAGLSDVALGGGGGVWMWREMEGGEDGGGMDVAAQSWMQRVCLHAVCLAEPDADSEAWDAVSAVQPSGETGETVVLRASRDMHAGEQVLLDYGGRSNAELLTTHGFALESNPHESIPITLAPRDELASAKTAILTAGNLTEPYALSPAALNSDSDLLVALRIIAATPVELGRYADAFGGKQLSKRNEIKWRRLLKETVQAMATEAEAVTSADDDAAALAALSRPAQRTAAPGVERGTSSPVRATVGGSARGEARRRVALITRMGEKLLLREVLAEIDKGLEGLKG